MKRYRIRKKQRFFRKKACVFAICDRTVCVVDRFKPLPDQKIASTYHEEQTTKRDCDLKVSRKYYQRIPAVIAIVTLAI